MCRGIKQCTEMFMGRKWGTKAGTLQSRRSFSRCQYVPTHGRFKKTRTISWPNNIKGRSLKTTTKSTPSPSTDSTSPKNAEDILRRVKGQQFTAVPSRGRFPWRHDPNPLPRLIKGTREYYEEGGELGPGLPVVVPGYFRYLLSVIAGNKLQIPLHKAMLPLLWKQDLADSCAWAFSQGVAGMLSNTYHVPFDNILHQTDDLDNDDEESCSNYGNSVNFDYKTTPDITPRESDEINNHEDDKDKMEERVEGIGNCTSKNRGLQQNQREEGGEEKYCSEVEYMLETKLRELYKNAHNFGKDQIQVKLQTRPISATVISIWWVPFISRSIVKKDKELRHLLLKLEETIEEKEKELGREIQITDAFDLGSNFARYIGDKTMKHNNMEDFASWESTVILQVEVDCLEMFSVKDLKTGRLLQGYDDELFRPAKHLVRLENPMETKFPFDGSKPIHEVGSWQITDWDDLLDGNIWYL